MKRILVSATALALFAVAPTLSSAGGCPPGLAKKAVPCVPPGQAKKGNYTFGPGDYVGDYDYHRIRYPDRYDLPSLRSGERYVIVGNQLLRVSDDTHTVLALVRLVEAILD